MNELQNRYTEEIRTILAKYPDGQKRSALLPLLRLAQREQNVVSRQAVDDIAEILGIGVSEIVSIIHFYTLFHLENGGRWRIQVCTDLSCAMRGADEFLRQLEARLGIQRGETTPDGLFTLEEVKCLAACHRAPLFQLQGKGRIDYYENQTVEKVMALVEELRREAVQ